MYDTGGDTNSIKVLLGDGTGKYEGDWETWDTNIWYDSDNVTNRFVSGDYDGDGKDDIAALYDYTYYDATDSGQVQVFRSTGTDFASKEWWYYGGKRAYDASKTAGLVSADYNGDGISEIHALYDMGAGQANVYEFRKKEDFALDRFALVTDAWNSYAVLVEDENAASGLLESVTNGTNAAIRYTYDGNGNITEIHEGTQLKARYAYDSLNQLIREDNAYTGKTVTYTYDAGGNILGKTEYTYTTGELGNPTRTVVYGYTDSTWKDLLTSYDGTAITYDTIGNPQNWRGGMSFTWQNGRQLAGISKDGLTTSYAYNDSGIRLRKTVNGVTTQYYLNGSMIVAEVTGDVQTDYYYDESGNVFGFKRGNSEYYYIRNGQGDIIGILDSSGTQIVSYVYDSWGKLVSISGSQAETIGEANPFRYRGYYYDTETGLYYLNSRYYDPEVGRFLNADGLLGANEDILSYNLFLYCSNNPINYYDPTGHGIREFFEGIRNGITEYVNGFINDYNYLHYEDDAKEKYNEDTVSINGSDPSAPVQVTIDPDNTKANDIIDPDIRIEDSYKIKSQYEKEAILDVIINSDEYDPSVFTRSKDDYLTEWNAHNNFYAMFSWTPWGDNAKDVDLNELDRGKQIVWDILGYVDLS